MDTNIGLNESVRQQIAQNLGMLLADTFVLYVKTQNFHWNIMDARFYSMHKFLEKEYKKLRKSIDKIAERIRALGERSPGSLKQLLKMTSLKESNGDLLADEMLQELLKDHEFICRFIRERIILAARLGDEGTAELLIQQLRAHEKSAWLLRSHLVPLVV
jgi:starvation-inducible DNA-binding protein